MLGLINELLDLAAVEAGKTRMSIQPLNLCAELADGMAMIRPIAVRRSIALSASVGDEFVALGDRSRLRQVLLNLLSNAVKYSPDGSTVDVVCANIGNRVRLSVVDRGAGMTPEQVAALYQPFNRLGREADNTEGSGIGLVVTKNLVELMGGTIGVDSTPNVGSTFWIEMLANSADTVAALRPDAVAASESREAAAASAAVTILYMEDDPSSRQFIAEVLTKRPNTTVLTAPNGRIGVELARRHLPSVILIDNNMPEITGRQARELLRSDPATAGSPIIALSGSAPELLTRELEPGEFFRFIAKPAEVQPVLDAIDDALRFKPRRP